MMDGGKSEAQALDLKCEICDLPAAKLSFSSLRVCACVASGDLCCALGGGTRLLAASHSLSEVSSMAEGFTSRKRGGLRRRLFEPDRPLLLRRSLLMPWGDGRIFRPLHEQYYPK